MQRYLAVVMETAVKVPLQKVSVSHIVTRQDAVILTPIAFAVLLLPSLYMGVCRVEEEAF